MSKRVIQGIGHVFYPESCPVENVLEHILSKYKCCLSPIHNRDTTKDGTLKKPHYHLLFQGNLSEKDRRFISKITTMQYFEPIYDFNSAYHYLYHWTMKTNWFIDGKAQYWSADIKKGDLFDEDIINSSTNSNDDNFNCMLSLLWGCVSFRDFYTQGFSDLYSQDFKQYILSQNSFVNNWYRNGVKSRSSMETDCSAINHQHRREKRELRNDDYERSLYGIDVDENDFLLSNFKPISF